MAETYKKIDEDTLEITSTSKGQITKGELIEELESLQRRRDSIDEQISIINTKLAALK